MEGENSGNHADLQHDEYRSLKFLNEDDVSRYLKCPICFKIYNNPKRLLLCGHTFCEKCCILNHDSTKKQNSTNQCLLCNQNFTNEHLQDDLIAKKIIDDLKVSCQRTTECQWAGSVQEHRMHIKNNECS